MTNTIEALYGEDWFPCSILKISTKFDSQLDGRIFVEILSTVPDKNDSYWQDCVPHTRLRINKTILSRQDFFSFLEETKTKKVTIVRRKRLQEITTRTRRNKKVKTTCGFVFSVEEIERLIKTYYRDAELAKKSDVRTRKALKAISDLDFSCANICLDQCSNGEGYKSYPKFLLEEIILVQAQLLPLRPIYIKQKLWDTERCVYCDNIKEKDGVLVRCDGCIFFFHETCAKIFGCLELHKKWLCPLCRGAQKLIAAVKSVNMCLVREIFHSARYISPFWRAPKGNGFEEPDENIFRFGMNAIESACNIGNVELLQLILAPFISSRYRADKTLYVLPPGIKLDITGAILNGNVECSVQMYERQSHRMCTMLADVTRSRKLRNVRQNPLDFTTGLEQGCVFWGSQVDMNQFSDDFPLVVYIRKNIEHSSVSINWTVPGKPCHCPSDCAPMNTFIQDTPCEHVRINGCFVECNDKCACAKYNFNFQQLSASSFINCGRRPLSCGLRFKLQIQKTKNRGYGLFAMERIPPGEFVIEYVGELISTEENELREKIYEEKGITAFYTWQLNKDIIIDATRFRNASAFVNHQCSDNNLVPRKIYVHNSLPRLGFFSTKEIKKDDELTLEYWKGLGRSKKSRFMKCLCHYCVRDDK